MTSAPLISICIPVFQTEKFLERCFNSVLLQRKSFDSFEVILVNDCSDGIDENGRNCKKIVKDFSRKHHLKINYLEHSVNRGIMETRRSLVYEAKGKYIAMIDSDDLFAPDALKTYYDVAVDSGADIVHGRSIPGVYENDQFFPVNTNRYTAIHIGEVLNHDIFHKWLIKREFTGNCWGKLIKREVFLEALHEIPYTNCNMAEDVMLFFYISQFSKKYIGIEKPVYFYVHNTGISSNREIDSLKRWELVCSTSSVFSVLSNWIAEKQENNECTLSHEEIDGIKKMTAMYLSNNLKQMHEKVLPSLRPQAREMLCEYWGESFVDRIEKMMLDDLDTKVN